MPALVGGFGNEIKVYVVQFFKHINDAKKQSIISSLSSSDTVNKIATLQRHGPYLAGLIEGDGTFAIQDPNSLNVKKYNPQIIVAFKLMDLELAEFLCSLTGCGTVTMYKDRNYVL